MATSKSPEVWTAGALLYSGRRNPTWHVSTPVVRKLQKVWRTLPPEPESRPAPAGLGYRGIFLRDPADCEWIAFDGSVSLKTHGQIQSRSDPTEEFERAVLASAPAGLLPPKLARGGGR